MITPERVNESLKLILPLVVAALLVIYGMAVENLALIATGAGALGLPGLGSLTNGSRSDAR